MTTTSPPNVVIINCDDLGYGDLGCYGSTEPATSDPTHPYFAAEYDLPHRG
jgi:arylsulfatase A-like enzyme